MASRIWDIIMYSLLIAAAVLVVTHASAVAQLLATGGNIWLGETSLLTGLTNGQYKTVSSKP